VPVLHAICAELRHTIIARSLPITELFAIHSNELQALTLWLKQFANLAFSLNWMSVKMQCR